LQRVRPDTSNANSEDFKKNNVTASDLSKQDYIGILRRFEFEAKF
jgi:hypothetical protein